MRTVVACFSGTVGPVGPVGPVSLFLILFPEAPHPRRPPCRPYPPAPIQITPEPGRPGAAEKRGYPTLYSVPGTGCALDEAQIRLESEEGAEGCTLDA